MQPIKKLYDLTLDLKRESNIQLKGIVDGDTGNVLRIRLTHDGAALNNDDVSVSRVILNVRSNAGWRSQDSMTEDSGITIDNGLITISLFPDTYTEGNNYAQLEIYSTEDDENDTLVTTQQFTFYAKKGSQTELETSEAFPALTKAINAVYAALADLYAVAGQSENLLEESVPLSDSISATTDTIWRATCDIGVSLPTIMPNRYIAVGFPANRADKLAVRLERDQRFEGGYVGHAQFLNDLKKGDVITVSCEIQTDVELIVSAGIQNQTNYERVVAKQVRASDTYVTVSWSMTIDAEWDNTDDMSLFFILKAPVGANAFFAKLRSIKAEKRDIASGWTAAAADVKELFSTAVRTTPQKLDADEKTQALKNVGVWRGTTDPAEMVDIMDDMDLYYYYEEVE